ncbi:MAG: hypothetical protein ACRBI6_07485 [Acidimicrobiales bacterium]
MRPSSTPVEEWRRLSSTERIERICDGAELDLAVVDSSVRALIDEMVSISSDRDSASVSR